MSSVGILGIFVGDGNSVYKRKEPRWPAAKKCYKLISIVKSIRPIHPFPARMAPEVVWKELPKASSGLFVLDPMAGSGTTLVTARLRGHNAIGFDRDPLAVLLSSTWTSNFDAEVVEMKAQEVLKRARELAGDAFPSNADEETKDFIRYWFDPANRIQLTALSKVISRLRDTSIRNLMWCAFSRMIITKQSGVSLAMDVSHSRPHKKYETAPVEAFARFTYSVGQIVKASPFTKGSHQEPRAVIRNADARRLPLKANTVDIVITSPPYLNAIDYLRGHKLSLVWMGYSISKLRSLRSTNVGTEVGAKTLNDKTVEGVIGKICDAPALSNRNVAMLRKYIIDTQSILTEIHRVLRPSGKAVVVVGNCNIRDVFIKNSRAIEIIAGQAGLIIQKIRKRPIPENRRYLPPPTTSSSGKHLQKRMREEVILTFIKPQQRN